MARVELPALKEKDFQRTVIEYARGRGWMVAHFGNTVKIVRRGSDYKTIPDRGAAGFPDLVLVRTPRVVYAELKGEKGKLSEEQALWLRALGLCGQDVHVWRPSDWPTIEAVLE